MATIGKIRKHGTLLIIVIGLGLFAFIAEELVRSCEATQNEQRMQVGKVLGEKISVQDYQELVDEYQEVIKITQGRDNLTEEQLNSIKDQVWETLVNTKIIEAEAKKLGLTVTDNELQNILKEGTHSMLLQTPFVNSQTGRFDVTALTKFLADYNSGVTANTAYAEQYEALYTYWKFMEKTLRQQLLASKYQALLINGCLLSNPISAKAYFESRNTESTIHLAALAYSSVNDNDVEVTEADLKTKYEAKKEMFRQYVESRDIKYVAFKVVASSEDRAALMETMNEAAEALKVGEDPATTVRKAQSSLLYTGLPLSAKGLPRDIAKAVDTMAVGKVLAPFETKSDNTLNVIKLIAKKQLPDSVDYRAIQLVGNTIEEARERGDSVYKALKGGADFEEIAAVYGQDGSDQLLTSTMYESSQVIDGDTKNYLMALLTSPVGELKNLEMPQGNIILQVTGRRNIIDKYDVAVVKHTIDFSKSTYSSAYNKFSQYVSENQNDVEGLQANAESYGFRVLERNDMVNSEHNVANIRGTREALKWIFDAKEGDISPLYECGDNDHLLVIAMTKIHPIGYRSLEDVRSILSAEVLKDKKYDMLCGRLYDTKTVDDAAKVGAVVSDVEHVTFSNPVFVQATGTSEAALAGAVAVTENGATATGVVKGTSGAYKFSVTSRGTREGAAEVTDESLSSAEIQLEKNAGQAASRFMSELFIKANVVDNRYLFF